MTHSWALWAAETGGPGKQAPTAVLLRPFSGEMEERTQKAYNFAQEKYNESVYLVTNANLYSNYPFPLIYSWYS